MNQEKKNKQKEKSNRITTHITSPSTQHQQK